MFREGPGDGWNGAIEDYGKAIEIDSHNAVAWARKANVLDQQELHTEALEAYNKSCEFNSSNSITWNNRGLALKHLGRYEEAVSSFDLAIKLNSSDIIALSNKGDALAALGKNEDAENCLNRALALNPNDQIVIHDLSDLKASAQEAKQSAKLMAKMDPETWDLYLILKQMCSLTGDLGSAYLDMQGGSMDPYACKNDSDCLKKTNEYKDLEDKYNALVAEYGGLAFKYNSKMDALWAGRSWYNKYGLPESLGGFSMSVIGSDRSPCTYILDLSTQK